MELSNAELGVIRGALRQAIGIGSINPEQQVAKRTLLARVVDELEADRIQRENEARVSSAAYRKTAAKVARGERSIRREVR